MRNLLFLILLLSSCESVLKKPNANETKEKIIRYLTDGEDKYWDIDWNKQKAYIKNEGRYTGFEYESGEYFRLKDHYHLAYVYDSNHIRYGRIEDVVPNNKWNYTDSNTIELDNKNITILKLTEDSFFYRRPDSLILFLYKSKRPKGLYNSNSR